MTRKVVVWAPPGSPEALRIQEALNVDENNMPRGLTGGEYQAGLEIPMADEIVTPPVSPTGTPILSTKIAPWLAVLAIVVAAVIGLPEAGVAVPAVVLGIAKVVSAILVALGIVSAGARK